MLSILDFLRLRNRERTTFLENRHAFSNVPSTIAAGYNTFLRFINGERNARTQFSDEGAPRKKEIAGRIVENCTLGHYETANAERFVTYISSREETQAARRGQTTSGDLGVPACGPHAASPSSRSPVPTPFVSQSRQEFRSQRGSRFDNGRRRVGALCSGTYNAIARARTNVTQSGLRK